MVKVNKVNITINLKEVIKRKEKIRDKDRNKDQNKNKNKDKIIKIFLKKINLMCLNIIRYLQINLEKINNNNKMNHINTNIIKIISQNHRS
jgi:hypothetical protein